MMPRVYRFLMLAMLLLAVCLPGFAVEQPAAETAPSAARPAAWAEPIEMTGVPNLHKVSDALYRSAQPTAEGMRNLKELGVKTIINLRSFHSDRGEIGETGLGYEHIYMKAWHPEEKEVVRFLQLVTDPDRTPVLVHCMHGADRTGVLSAVYRVAAVSYTHLRAHETVLDLVCRLLLEKKNKHKFHIILSYSASLSSYPLSFTFFHFIIHFPYPHHHP